MRSIVLQNVKTRNSIEVLVKGRSLYMLVGGQLVKIKKGKNNVNLERA